MRTSQIFLTLLIVISIALNILFLYPTYSDENLYMAYSRELVSNGKIPYRDFFFGHPPLELYTLSLFMIVGGFNIYIAKLLPIVCSHLSVVLIYLICKEYNERSALLVSALFLISPYLVSTSRHVVNTWPGIMLCLLSVYLLQRRKVMESAALLIIALMFKYLFVLYILPVLYLAFKRGLDRKLAKSVLIFGSLVLVMMVTIFGMVFIEDTVIYNFEMRFGEAHYTGEQSIVQHLLLIGPVMAFCLFYFLGKRTPLFPIAVFMDICLFLLTKSAIYHLIISAPIYYMVLAEFFSRKEFWLTSTALILVTSLFTYPIISRSNLRAYQMENAVDFMVENGILDFKGNSIVKDYFFFKTGFGNSSSRSGSYTEHINAGQTILNEVEISKPGYVVLSTGEIAPYSDILSNYELMSSFEGFPSISVYKLKN
jgi:hypothetical protein